MRNVKALAAEISPAPKVVLNQNNLFTEPQIVECKYMIALARPYLLGSEETTFEVQFGDSVTTPVSDEPDAESIESFRMHKIHNLSLTKDELATWGENDEVCLTLIAQKLNTTCVSFKEF